MRLKQEITDVLDKLGATDMDRLVEYFANRASEANGALTAIDDNIASLQKQREEVAALRDATLAGIAKFVTDA